MVIMGKASSYKFIDENVSDLQGQNVSQAGGPRWNLTDSLKALKKSIQINSNWLSCSVHSARQKIGHFGDVILKKTKPNTTKADMHQYWYYNTK